MFPGPREACAGLFAVQCEAEGHGMVLKLGIKGGERWAGRIQHQLPLLLPHCGEEVMARSESSSADVTCQTYTITVICCRQGGSQGPVATRLEMEFCLKK